MLAMGQEIYHAKESPPNLTSCQYMKKHGKGKIRGIAKVFGRTKHINTAKSMIYCRTDEAADKTNRLRLEISSFFYKIYISLSYPVNVWYT